MKLILAADKNWAIGKDGDLLCHLSGDLKYFKEQTLGKVVVMGRATLESLPGQKPLPKRINIVLTSDKNYDGKGAVIVNSKNELLTELKKYNSDDVMIIGGAKVYKDFLDDCDTCFITKIYDEFKADKYFVDLDAKEEFKITWKSEMQEENGIRYQFFKYEKK